MSQNSSEEVVFQAVVFCGGSTSGGAKAAAAATNDEGTSSTCNGFIEEVDLYIPPSPGPADEQVPEPMDFDHDNFEEDPDYIDGDNDSDSDEPTKFKVVAPKTRQKRGFAFNRKAAGIKPVYVNKITTNKPYDVFRMILDDRLLQKMVDATNKHAKMCKENNKMVNSWIQPWRDTNIAEMRKFIGIIMWMGLVKYPTMNSYWCRSHLYTNSVMNAISRSQFLLLSHMWKLGTEDDRYPSLVTPLLNGLKKKFKQMLVPPEVFTIEKMFIPTESETEGVNILYLNVKGGYIYNYEVLQGKRLRTISVKDAMNLCEGLLDQGRTLCSNEDLTSMTLAKRLIERKTHITGMLNPNSSHIPPELKTKRVYGNQSEACTTDTGITIRKYNPFSEQYLLSSRKTSTVAEYYKYRSITAVSHDLKINNHVLINSLNWYQKFAIEIIINTCIVNACFLFRKTCTKKISSIRFLEDVITGLLDLPINLKPSSLSLSKLGIEEEIFAPEHQLVKMDKPKRCIACYERISREEGRKMAMNRAPKASHECDACKKSFCVDCFFKLHTSRLKVAK